MSQKNRKFMYDKLVAAGRQKDICQSLENEFGKPDTPKAPEEKKKVKK